MLVMPISFVVGQALPDGSPANPHRVVLGHIGAGSCPKRPVSRDAWCRVRLDAPAVNVSRRGSPDSLPPRAPHVRRRVMRAYGAAVIASTRSPTRSSSTFVATSAWLMIPAPRRVKSVAGGRDVEADGCGHDEDGGAEFCD